jgi:outer membrane protein
MPSIRSIGAMALFGFTALGHAQAQTSPWTVRVGAAHVGFSPKADVFVNGSLVPDGGASASDNTTLGVEVSYDLSPRWTARFLAGIPPTTTLRGSGSLGAAGTLGKVTYGPAVLTATWNLLESGPVRPYVGAGLNYTVVFKSQDGFISNLDVRSAFGSVLEVGVEVPLNDGWSVALDARKIFLKTKADGVLPAMGGAAAHADVRLDPLVVFASVGRRF